ncbi:MAG: DNA polymerase III subunit beta [Roseburia sp.]|nr:DNA polymerase III subunit beta [Roseburia sp.]
MKIICSKANLLNGVNTVSKAVPSKTTMSILECILIDASKGQITLTANDMELGIETVIDGEIMEKGIIALEAKLFLEMVRKLPDNDVMIETDSSYKATITCEKAKFDIAGKSGEDFSYLPQIERSESICVSQFTLKEVIRQTIFSIADNFTNKILTGELFEINGDVLKVVSSDGLRISLRKINLKNTYPAKKVIVPGKTLNEIAKILSGDTDRDVNIFFTDRHILFEFDSTTVVSRLIEGEYLKIDNILAADYETKVRLNKKEFQSCIDRSTLLIKEGEKKPLILNILDEVMELKMNSVVGSLNEEIDITKMGKDLMIGFDPKFLMDALKVIDDEEVEIKLLNSKAPCFIKDEEESYTYLILPVTFNMV